MSYEFARIVLSWRGWAEGGLSLENNGQCKTAIPFAGYYDCVPLTLAGSSGLMAEIFWWHISTAKYQSGEYKLLFWL